MITTIDEVVQFVVVHTRDRLIHPDTDLFESGLFGDDLGDLLHRYSETYSVDMSTYLWYFHNEEEGHNWAAKFFKPPYMRVSRIPITPRLLAEFAESKKWAVPYPDHTIPKIRYDIILMQVGSVLLILLALAGFAIQRGCIFEQ